MERLCQKAPARCNCISSSTALLLDAITLLQEIEHLKPLWHVAENDERLGCAYGHVLTQRVTVAILGVQIVAILN
jgi:hypothetical protein